MEQTLAKTIMRLLQEKGQFKVPVICSNPKCAKIIDPSMSIFMINRQIYHDPRCAP